MGTFISKRRQARQARQPTATLRRTIDSRRRKLKLRTIQGKTVVRATKKVVLRISTRKPTYSVLAKQFEDIGEKLATLPGGKASLTLKPGDGYKPSRVSKLLGNAQDINDKRSRQKHDDAYRDIHPGQDELVSTSSVRQIMKGISASGKLSSDQQEKLEEAFELLSKLRFPTKWTGFSLKNDVMQHPTSRSSGLFAESEETMSRHNALDRARAGEVAEACLAALKAPKATAHSVVNAAMRAAIGFSLNEFIAPATASDVRPFSLARGRDRDQEVVRQVAAREELKAILVRLGGTQDSGGTALDREWSSRRGMRSASPVRSVPKGRLKQGTVMLDH